MSAALKPWASAQGVVHYLPFGEGNLDAWVLKLSADGDISSCQEGLIGTTDVIPYNTKASVRRSSVTGQNTHVIPQESHQSVKDTYVISGDVCVDTAPDISVQPDCTFLNFGSVAMGDSSTKHCTVLNKGTIDLKISSIKIREIFFVHLIQRCSARPITVQLSRPKVPATLV